MAALSLTSAVGGCRGWTFHQNANTVASWPNATGTLRLCLSRVGCVNQLSTLSQAYGLGPYLEPCQRSVDHLATGVEPSVSAKDKRHGTGAESSPRWLDGTKDCEDCTLIRGCERGRPAVRGANHGTTEHSRLCDAMRYEYNLSVCRCQWLDAGIAGEARFHMTDTTSRTTVAAAISQAVRFRAAMLRAAMLRAIRELGSRST